MLQPLNMQEDKIHILSTGDIPSFTNPSSRIILSIRSFQEIQFLRSPGVEERIAELINQSYFAIFTSANAVKAVGALLEDKVNKESRNPRWNCFCVGEKTKENLLKLMPYCKVLATADLAAELSREIIEARPSPLIFFSGNLRREELPVQLKTNNIGFEEIVVYKTVYTPIALKQHYDGILFFSPGAVNAYFAANKPDPETVLFAIGPTTESALHKQTKNKVLTTDRPDKAALAKMALQYFEAY